ncbi:MAG TPA: GPW/gp25 family protein [Myxococcota bacterium]|nr:GPW/gp25 family protein [Myxococcota bacterium]
MSALFGLLPPLQRDKKRDFASGTGEALLRSHVRQVLLTQGTSHLGPGELPWRCEFGSPLHTQRHLPMDAASLALARSWVTQAFSRWLPHLRLMHVRVEQNGPVCTLDITFGPLHGPEQTLIIPLGGSA